MKDWVESRAETGRYSNASDYVRDLIRRDQERAEKIAAIQRLIDEAEDSGVNSSSMDDILAAARIDCGPARMAYRLSRKAEEDILDMYITGAREFGADQAERYHAGL